MTSDQQISIVASSTNVTLHIAITAAGTTRPLAAGGGGAYAALRGYSDSGGSGIAGLQE
jgi:hypothetical protein